jgi:hypothetical protein
MNTNCTAPHEIFFSFIPFLSSFVVPSNLRTSFSNTSGDDSHPKNSMLPSVFLAVLDFIFVAVEPDNRAQGVSYTEPALYFETASNKSLIIIICSQITAYSLVTPPPLMSTSKFLFQLLQYDCPPTSLFIFQDF